MADAFLIDAESFFTSSLRCSFEASPIVLHVKDTNPTGRDVDDDEAEEDDKALPVWTLTVEGRPTTRGALDVRIGAGFGATVSTWLALPTVMSLGFDEMDVATRDGDKLEASLFLEVDVEGMVAVTLRSSFRFKPSCPN